MSMFWEPKWTTRACECRAVTVLVCVCHSVTVCGLEGLAVLKEVKGQSKLLASTSLTPTPAALLVTCGMGSGPRGLLVPATCGKEW